MPPHHDIFKRFDPWQGEVEPDYSVNFLGVVTRNSYAGLESKHSKQFVRLSLPDFNEEYFEWIDLLEAVIHAKERYTMIELGAGYGRWLINAVAALKRVKSFPYTLIGVEPEPTHFEWMRLHFKDNGVNPRRSRLIKAAAAGKDGSLWFYVGRPAEWYGQAIAATVPMPTSMFQRLRVNITGKAKVGNEEVRKVRAVSLNTILRRLTTVDLIDLDVQGAELEVLAAARDPLHKKVKRVHIGTHGAEIESGLRVLFNGLGWQNINDYGCGCECDTPYGKIQFQDGVQTWVNTQLL